MKVFFNLLLCVKHTHVKHTSASVVDWLWPDWDTAGLHFPEMMDFILCKLWGLTLQTFEPHTEEVCHGSCSLYIGIPEYGVNWRVKACHLFVSVETPDRCLFLHHPPTGLTHSQFKSLLCSGRHTLKTCLVGLSLNGACTCRQAVFIHLLTNGTTVIYKQVILTGSLSWGWSQWRPWEGEFPLAYFLFYRDVP